MIKAHLILSQTRLIFSRLTDFSSVLTEFNSIWSDFWSDSDPNPTRSTTRVFKPLNPNFSHFSEKRSRPFFVLHIAISDERSGDLRPAPTRPCPSFLHPRDLAATHTVFSGLFRRKPFFLPTRLLRRLLSPDANHSAPTSSVQLRRLLSLSRYQVPSLSSVKFLVITTIWSKKINESNVFAASPLSRYQVEETASDVETIQNSSSRVPYDQIKSQCEALVDGQQHKMSVLQSFKEQHEEETMAIVASCDDENQSSNYELEGEKVEEDSKSLISMDVAVHVAPLSPNRQQSDSFRLPPLCPYDKFLKAEATCCKPLISELRNGRTFLQRTSEQKEDRDKGPPEMVTEDVGAEGFASEEAGEDGVRRSKVAWVEEAGARTRRSWSEVAGSLAGNRNVENKKRPGTFFRKVRKIRLPPIMSYYPKGQHYESGDEVDDFDDYDSTPYGGGYDIHLTYGRPLPPSEEICYAPTSTSSGGFDYERSNYSSYAEPSAYGEEALDNEYKNYVRRKPRPGHQPTGVTTQHGGGYGGASAYGRPEEPTSEYGSGYGRRPEEPTSEYGSGYGRKQEEPTSEYGSGYGRKQEEPTSEYGSGYGRNQEEPTSEYGSGYGRKHEERQEEPTSEYGSGYGRKHEEPTSEYGSGYGRRQEEPTSEYGSGYGRQQEEPTSEYGSGYGRRKEEPTSEYGSGYGRRQEEPTPEYGSGYGRQQEEPTPEYGSGHGRRQEEPVSEYGSGYGQRTEEEHPKPSYSRRDDDEDEGRHGGHKKYGDDGSEDDDDDDDDDDEKKKHRRHHRKHYDD
ncbi:hypothetical protein LXL04_013384 [Taraxacum kok-saghyz]